jgi:threonine synthase
VTIRHVSTRGGVPPAGFEEVLLAGLAADGGLYVPETWPQLSAGELRALQGLDYPATAARLLAPFTAEVAEPRELLELCHEAYDGFAHPATAPLRQLGPDLWLLELFHGPTLAFKDFALQLLGRLFERVLERRGRAITILGATSGDTGSAAIRACAGRRGMRIVILHPEGRVSEVQRRQMTTALDANVHNIAIRGSFDDCQALVKRAFGDRELRQRLGLAAVNSINWARIAAQIVYYVYAALRLGAPERLVAFAVPTGNFGDVYAGYAASRIGLPVARLMVATNRNDILARFFATGVYEAGEVVPTLSPSMDIQVASNLERLLLDLSDDVGALMERFRTERRLELSHEQLHRARLLAATRVDEEATLDEIRRVHEETGAVIDPHSAVGVRAARALGMPPEIPVVALATAHPAKFPDAVERAIGLRPALPPHMADLYERPERYQIEEPDFAALKARLLDLPDT